MPVRSKRLNPAKSLWVSILGAWILLATPLGVRAQGVDSLPGTVNKPKEAPEVPSSGAAARLDYVIGPEDVLDIDVFEMPELTKTVRVGNDGTISLALLGHVQAAGLTASHLRKELETRWGKNYLENPQVSVYVREYHAQPVSVIGAVAKPGIYQLTGPRTLIDILSMAGGLAVVGGSPGPTVYVTRKGGFGALPEVDGIRLIAAEKCEIKLHRLLYSREDALNIEIRPLDTISVSKAETIYVVGDVRKPGGFVLEDRETVTVLQALAMAEGVNATAAKHKARIVRQGANGYRTEIPVDLAKVLSGKSKDLPMIPDDILFVPGSAAKTAAKRGAEASIGVVSGLIIYRRF